MAPGDPAVGVNWHGVGISLRAGAVVAGRYRLERLLGRGGMGAVWAATHTVTRRGVAMKFVHGPAHERSELRHRFLREARASATVQHPNVVDVLDVFELDADTPVMVMDLLTGETLGERIEREEQLSLEDTAALLLAVVSAVGTAHARGIVHRDLTPENIFLAHADGERPVVKVLDFGIAKLSSADSPTSTTRAPVTQTGRTLGTPCYMAPEQATGELDLDHRVDVWALGVILYECLSGIRPIDGESIGQVVMRLMSTGITPLERVVLGLPEDVTALVGRMLARERSRRPADLREVAEVLSRFTDVSAPAFGAPGTEIAAAPPSILERASKPSTGPPKTRTNRYAWLIAVAAAIALAFGALLMRAPTPTSAAQPAPIAANDPGPLVSEPAASPTSQPSAAKREPIRTAPAPKRRARAPRPRTAPPPVTTATTNVSKAPAGLAETPPF